MPKPAKHQIEKLAVENSAIQSPAPEPSNDQKDTRAEGNFILDELSLVQRMEQSNRFTEKFRDNTVERILSNQVAISKVGHELDVSESDLQFWINQWIRKRIELLQLQPELAEQILESMRSTTNSENFNTSSSPNMVIEGRVNTSE